MALPMVVVDPIVVQACAVVPLILGLITRVALRSGNGPLHWCLVGLLASIAGWVASIGVTSATGSARAGGTLALVLASPLPPLYLLTIALHTRVAAFEKSPALCLASCVPFLALAVLIATNEHHGLVLRGERSALLPPSEWAGPGFWAFEAWTYAYLLTGLGFLLHTFVLGPTRDDRRRAALIVAATIIPLAAHSAHLLGWLPLGYPVTPGALGLTALLIVVGIDRLALLAPKAVRRIEGCATALGRRGTDAHAVFPGVSGLSRGQHGIGVKRLLCALPGQQSWHARKQRSVSPGSRSSSARSSCWRSSVAAAPFSSAAPC